MMRNLNITVIIDNQSRKPELHSEHGLSFWIEADNHRILFDTGQSDMLIRNAEVLGIDLRSADTLVLSHGHYDHTGGLAPLLDMNPDLSVYCHSGIFMPRYSKQPDGTMKPVGINASTSSALHRIIDRIQWVNEPALVSNDIGITGPVPRISNFEDTGGSFYLDPEARNVDPISDDLSLWFRTTKGIVVVTGCCHSGIVNTFEYVKTITGQVEIHAIIGGLHLLHALPERLEKTCEYLRPSVSGKIYSCHCSGKNAIDFLRTKFGDRIIAGNAGACFQFD